jgi:hypothetical protein
MAPGRAPTVGKPGGSLALGQGIWARAILPGDTNRDMALARSPAGTG